MIPDYIYAHALDEDWVKNNPRIVNLLAATRTKSDLLRRTRAFVDPKPGQVDRLIYDCKETTKAPSDPTATDAGTASTDGNVLHLLKQAKDIDEANSDVMGRNGWGNKGNDHICLCNYDKNYNNAFFDGTKFTFGNGDGVIFVDLGKCRDVHAHEYGHGYVQTTSGSRYFGESGALNEHVADVHGIVLDAYLDKKKISEQTWLIGAGCIADQAKSEGWKAIRTCTTEKAYPRDPQPKFMKDKRLGEIEISDNFGVHIWSGILNHAFMQYATKQESKEYLHDGLMQVFALAAAQCGPLGGFRKYSQALQKVCNEREPKTSSALVAALKHVQLIK